VATARGGVARPTPSLRGSPLSPALGVRVRFHQLEAKLEIVFGDIFISEPPLFLAFA